MIQTWLCFRQQHLCLFHTVFEYIASFDDHGKMLVFPIDFVHAYFPDRINALFFPANEMSYPHTQIRIILFHGVRIIIPNWKPSPNRAAIGFSQVAFPTTVLPKDDRTDFAQEERLRLPYWTMIWAICVVVDASKYLDIRTEFSMTMVHLPF